jgi:hypothetical protein
MLLITHVLAWHVLDLASDSEQVYTASTDSSTVLELVKSQPDFQRQGVVCQGMLCYIALGNLDTRCSDYFWTMVNMASYGLYESAPTWPSSNITRSEHGLSVWMMRKVSDKY